MKKQTKLILFLSLAVMLLAITAIAACAATPFSANGEAYATLEEAVANVPGGGTVTVTQNVSVTSATLAESKAYTIMGSSSDITITFSGRLTISAGTVTLQNITIESSADYTIFNIGSSTTLNVKSGVTIRALTSSTTAITSGNRANLNIDAGTIYGMIGVAPQPYSGPIVTINGGTFYPNEYSVSEGKTAYLVNASRASTNLTVNGGTFDLTGGGTAAIVCNAETANVTITGGTFKGGTTEGQKLLYFRLGTFVISGGTFNSSAPSGYLLYLSSAMKEGKNLAPSLTITNGTFTARDTCRLLMVEGTNLQYGQFQVNISGGTFIGSAANEGKALITVSSGKFAISGGTFTAKCSFLFDLSLRKSISDSFTVTGGTFSLEESDATKSSAFIRTRIGVDFTQLNGLDANKDPIETYYVSDADILLSGGIFIDRRKSTSPLIDASIGSSAVTVNGAVLLSRYVKNYMIDVDNTVGADVPFAGNTVTVTYNNSSYYCYRAYAAGATEYAPVMDDGAYVALTTEYQGLRFSSTLPASLVSSLAGKSYTFGTLIAPADYVASAGGFTHAILNAWATKGGIAVPFVDIVASKSITPHDDGSISFNGALVNLNSFTRAYAAVAYVKIGNDYYYSGYSVENNARTMAYVAKMAYTEVLDDDSYYDSLYMPGAYSEYTEDEQKYLVTVSGYTHTRETVVVTPSITITPGTNPGANLQSKITELTNTLRGYGYSTGGTPVFVGSKGTLATTALSEVEGYGYYIGVIDGTIVIAGSNDALTMQAIGVFSDMCRGGSVRLTEIVCSNVEMTPLTPETPFVYSHTRDNRVHNIHLYGTDHYSALGKNYAGLNFNSTQTHLYNKDTHNNSVGLDYPLLAAVEIGGALANGDFEAGFTFTYVPDNFTVSGTAVYIGNTARTREVLLQGKDVGYYGYAVKGGNVFIGSYDDATLRLAKAMFLEALGDFALDTNGDGTADIYAIPKGYSFENGSATGFTGDFEEFETSAGGNGDVTAELAGLITNYPRPENLALSGAVSVSNSELELYYLNAKEQHYKDYCVLLEEKGYVPYMAEREIDGSYFVTYVNEDDGIMLHVIYNGYRWASAQKMDELLDTTLDTMLTPTLRVISAPTTVDYGYVHHVLPEKLLTKQSYKKITDSKLTVVQLDPRSSSTDTSDGSFGYCYVYTLEDGSFVVLDGGNGHTADVTNFYNVLAELHEAAHGSAPSTSNPIRIAAWYISHSHGDHVGLLNQMASYISSSSRYMKLESIIGNFPSNDEIYSAHSINQGTLNKMGTDDWFKNSDGTDVQFYNVHTGQHFYVGNMEFEVMFTTEDMHPWSMLAFNNACTVMRLTVNAHNVTNGNTVAAGAEPAYKVSNLVLGDIYVRPARIMRATFGTHLASDMVVSGHHSSGGEGELYELVNAKIVFWTCRAETMRSNTVDAADATGYRREDLQLIKNTRWLYMFTGRALKAYTDVNGYIYNPTMTITKDGIVGLEEGTTDAQVRSNAADFINGLENVAGNGELSYGENLFTDSAAYDSNGAVLGRQNYFSNTTLPDPIDWGELPELPPESEVPDISGIDKAPDNFGDETLVEFD